MVHRRSASPSHGGNNDLGDGNNQETNSPLRKGSRNQQQQRDLSPEQSNRDEGRRSRKGKQLQQPVAGFWPQLQQKASTIFSQVREPAMRFMRQPLQLLRKNMYTAISIAVFTVLIAGLIGGYSAYRIRQQNQGFIPRMKNAAQRAGDTVQDAFDSVRHSGEGYVDSAWHELQDTAAPVKKAFLNAKDKVIGATGLSENKAEGVLDSAKHTFENLGSNIKNIVDSTTSYFHGDDLTSSLKDSVAGFAHNAYDAASKKGEELTSATKKKAQDLTGMTQQKREELAKIAKKNVDSQSVAAKKKIDDAAIAAKKKVDDLADQAKKAADKAAGHSTWHFW